MSNVNSTQDFALKYQIVSVKVNMTFYGFGALLISDYRAVTVIMNRINRDYTVLNYHNIFKMCVF